MVPGLDPRQLFPLAKTFESHGVRFIHGEATQIDPKAQQVTSSNGQLEYDYLVIATGYLNDFSIIPGLGSDGNAFSITTSRAPSTRPKAGSGSSKDPDLWWSERRRAPPASAPPTSSSSTRPTS